jgi:hypothetical protein
VPLKAGLLCLCDTVPLYLDAFGRAPSLQPQASGRASLRAPAPAPAPSPEPVTVIGQSQQRLSSPLQENLEISTEYACAIDGRFPSVRHATGKLSNCTYHPGPCWTTRSSDAQYSPPSQDTPSAATAATSPYFQQLEAISSPVPNFAATLTTQSEDDANHENVSFLRTRLSRNPPESPASHSRRQRQPYLTEEEFERFESEREDRMRRAVDLNRRIRAAAAPYSSRHSPQVQLPPDNAVRENRIPRQQSLYDWPPQSDEEDDDDPEDRPNYANPQEYPNREPVPESAYAPWSRIARGDGSHPSRYPPERASQNGGAFVNQYNESSLATAALLQSVRRHPQFSRRTRNLSHQILEDYHSQQPRRVDADAERQRTRFPRPIHPNRETERSMYPDRYQPPEDRASAVHEANVQRHMDNRLVDVLRYLEHVRFCMSYEERWTTAALAGFSRGDYFSKNLDDFILDTTTITPPRETSWLKNGCVFSGAQQAAHGSLLHHREWTSGSRHGQGSYSRVFTPPGRSDGGENAASTSSRRYLARSPSVSSPQTLSTASSTVFDGLASERWPVTVTLHTIDYDTMTVSGTMEARSIPDKSSPTQESSITTFLEGEIIDFNKHSLETTNFKSDADIDATYWSRLMPFRDMNSEASVRSLLSRKWISERLQGKWVLMRWKGMLEVPKSLWDYALTIDA